MNVLAALWPFYVLYIFVGLLHLLVNGPLDNLRQGILMVLFWLPGDCSERVRDWVMK